MQDQPKYIPLRPSDFFDDHRSARPLPENTVARGHLNADTGFYTGKQGDKPVDRLPFPITRDVMARYLDATDQPTLMTCLFGDKAVAPLGFAPLGFSDCAGLALALVDAAALRSA